MRSRGRSRAGRPPGTTRGNRASLRAPAATASPIDRENERHKWVSRHLTEGRRASAYARLTLDGAGGEDGRTKDSHDASAEVIDDSQTHSQTNLVAALR